MSDEQSVKIKITKFVDAGDYENAGWLAYEHGADMVIFCIFEIIDKMKNLYLYDGND